MMKQLKILSLLIFPLLALSFSGQAQSVQTGFTADKPAVKQAPKNKSTHRANPSGKKYKANCCKASKKAFCASRDDKAIARKMPFKVRKSDMKKNKIGTPLKED